MLQILITIWSILLSLLLNMKLSRFSLKQKYHHQVEGKPNRMRRRNKGKETSCEYFQFKPEIG